MLRSQLRSNVIRASQRPPGAVAVAKAWDTCLTLCRSASSTSSENNGASTDDVIPSGKEDFGVLRQNYSGWLRQRHFEVVPEDNVQAPLARHTPTGPLISSKQVGKFQVSQYKGPDNFGSEDTTDHYKLSQNFSGLKKLFPNIRGSALPVPVLRSMRKLCGALFAEGFIKGSVPKHYFDYTKWSFAGAAASSAAMVLSTQAMLYAVGLGAGSIPTAAALNWVLKDGLGQLGGVLFASIVNKRFDSDAKRWRVIAAVSLDSAVAMQSITPLFPSLFLPLASVANMGMNVSWLAASASRLGSICLLHKHQIWLILRPRQEARQLWHPPWGWLLA